MNRSSSQSTKIPPNWLLPVRLAWIIIVVFYMTVFFITLPGELTKPPEFKVRNFTGKAWTPEQIAASASELGISIEFLGKFDKVLNTSLIGPLLFYPTGILIFVKKSDDWVPIAISLVFFVFLNNTGNLIDLSPAFKFLGDLTDVLSSTLLFVVFMIFPDGRFVPRWIRWVAIFTVSVQLLRLISEQVFGFYLPSIILTLLSIMYSQIYRYRRVASPAQRVQIKSVIFINGLGFGMLGLVLLSYFIFPPLAKPGPAGLAAFLLGSLIWTFFMIMLPVSFAIAILRSRLWDIDFIIRRTLVYAMLSGLLGLVYFGAVGLTQSFLTADRDQTSAVVIVATTLLIAAVFNPLRRRIQDFIDRRFYRQKYDTEKALGEFAAAARSQTSLHLLAGGLVKVVQETLQPETILLLTTSVDKKLSSPSQGGERE